MNTNQRSPYLLIVLSGLAVTILIIIWAVVSYAHHQTYSGQLKLAIAPSDSQVEVNGQKVAATATVDVKPGFTTVNVSRSGFTSQKKTVEVAKNKTVSVFVALISNDVSTADWYTKHPSDQTTLERITGQQYTQQSTQAVAQVPVIKELPFIGAGFSYRIDYGAPLPGTNVPGIYITAQTQQGQQNAVTWIKNQGYDPTTLHIQYVTGPVN